MRETGQLPSCSMALRECGLTFLTDAMASRHSGNRSVPAITPKDSYGGDDFGGQEDESEGRVVETLGHVAVENRWCLFVPNGSFPPARSKHAALSVGRRMFVLGGASGDGILDDVQVFHAEKAVWLQLGCGSVPSLYSPSRTIPVDARGPRCVGHCLAFWETKLLVLGGRIDPKSSKLKAFALDLQSQSWSILAPKGEIPVSRIGQTIVQVGSALILFGGEDSKGQMLNDLYKLDLKNLVWHPLKTTGPKPSPRKGHSAASYNERYMLVFGGKAHGNYFNDLYLLDLQTMEWIKEKPRGLVLSPRAGHAGVMVGSKWYIVGGEFKRTEIVDTLAYDMESRSWSLIATVQPGTPLANDGLSLVKVRNKGRTFLLAFGGHGAILSNQIFVMMISHNRMPLPSRKREDIDDFSTSSLPFSFTSGLHTYLTAGKDSTPPPETKTRTEESKRFGPEERIEDETTSNLTTPRSNNDDEAQAIKPVKGEHHLDNKDLEYYNNGSPSDLEASDQFADGALVEVEAGCELSSNRFQDAGSNTEEKVRKARDHIDYLESRLCKALSRNYEIENALIEIQKEKEAAEKRLQEALSVIDGLKRDVEALVECRVEGDRRLRAAQSQLDRFQVKIDVLQNNNNNSAEAAATSPNGEHDGADLQQQLRESQQQIVFAARKQALAERKLLGALKENRELRKKLLQVDSTER